MIGELHGDKQTTLIRPTSVDFKHTLYKGVVKLCIGTSHLFHTVQLIV